MYERVCPLCNTKFQTEYYAGLYCSDECKITADNESRKKARERSRKRYYEKKREEELRKQKAKSITEIAIAAREAGMTYGKYVSEMGL